MYKDIFELTGEKTNDHVWPLSKDGSSSSKNIQVITKQANQQKGDLTRGKVNGFRFSVTETGRTESGKRIGIMKVLKNGEWITNS